METARAGFAANRGAVGLSPEVRERAERAFRMASDSLQLRFSDDLMTRPTPGEVDLEDRVRGRELNHYWHYMLDLVPGGTDLPEGSGSTDSAEENPEGHKQV